MTTPDLVPIVNCAAGPAAPVAPIPIVYSTTSNTSPSDAPVARTIVDPLLAINSLALNLIPFK